MINEEKVNRDIDEKPQNENDKMKIDRERERG